MLKCGKRLGIIDRKIENMLKSQLSCKRKEHPHELLAFESISFYARKIWCR